jgi:hypothetical protein
MWQRHVLDHELGHALTMLKIDKQSAKHTSLMNKAECEADAYAAIRHFQRYGEDSTFPAMFRDVRTMAMVHKGDVVHWTARAIEEVMRINAQGGIKNLTPHESRDLAIKIAASTALSADAEHNIRQEFSATVAMSLEAHHANWPDGDRIMGYVERVAAIGAVTSSAGVLEVCKSYLSHYAAYAPKDLPMSKTAGQLKVIAADIKKLRARTVTTEPPMSGLKRLFRDAAIDFHSGAHKKPDTGNDNKKDKKPPRPPSGGNLDF